MIPQKGMFPLHGLSDSRTIIVIRKIEIPPPSSSSSSSIYLLKSHKVVINASTKHMVSEQDNKAYRTLIVALLQPPQAFYGPFSGTTGVSRCQKRTSGLCGARED